MGNRKPGRPPRPRTELLVLIRMSKGKPVVEALDTDHKAMLKALQKAVRLFEYDGTEGRLYTAHDSEGNLWSLNSIAV